MPPESNESSESLIEHGSRQPPVLITGLPRSGTTWLVRSMNRHPKVLVFGETHFFSRRWIAPDKDGTYSPDKLESLWASLSTCPFWAAVPLKEDLGERGPGWFTRTSRDDIPAVIESARGMVGSNPRPGEVLDAVGRAFCLREGKSFWVEKTAIEGKHAARTIRNVPDARFILTMRDPVGFMRSYKYQGIQHGRSTRDFYVDRYHPFLAALVWRRSYRSLCKLKNRHPEQVSLHVLSSEANRRAALESICRQLGVEPADEIFEGLGQRVNSSSLGAEDRALDRADIAWLRALCSVEDPEMAISDEYPKTGFLDLLKSVPSIIRWGIRYILRYRNKKTIPTT